MNFLDDLLKRKKIENTLEETVKQPLSLSQTIDDSSSVHATSNIFIVAKVVSIYFIIYS